MEVTNNKSLPLLKWLVWTSGNEGEYVRAHKVLEGKTFVSFIIERSDMDVEVRHYKLKDILEYKLVE